MVPFLAVQSTTLLDIDGDDSHGGEAYHDDEADALAEELSGSGKSVWVLGDGWAICEKALKERGVFCTVAPEELRWQTAFGVCLAAQSKTPTGAEDLLPVYLRLSQAERERQSRMNEA